MAEFAPRYSNPFNEVMHGENLNKLKQRGGSSSWSERLRVNKKPINAWGLCKGGKGCHNCLTGVDVRHKKVQQRNLVGKMCKRARAKDFMNLYDSGKMLYKNVKYILRKNQIKPHYLEVLQKNRDEIDMFYREIRAQMLGLSPAEQWRMRNEMRFVENDFKSRVELCLMLEESHEVLMNALNLTIGYGTMKSTRKMVFPDPKLVPCQEPYVEIESVGLLGQQTALQLPCGIIQNGSNLATNADLLMAVKEKCRVFLAHTTYHI